MNGKEARLDAQLTRVIHLLMDLKKMGTRS